MATMAPVATIPEQRVILPRVSWQTYEGLLADDPERRVPRLAYDQGVLEIVSPSSKHERDGFALAHVVVEVATELEVDYLPVGSTTFRRASLQRGFEADASFYFRNEPLVRDREQIDAEVDPPPDLVIEVDVSHPSLDKLPIYAGMGVPEVWRCVGDRVAILALETGAYRESDRSLALPALSADVLSRFMVEARTARWVEWIRSVRAWAGEQRAAAAAVE